MFSNNSESCVHPVVRQVNGRLERSGANSKLNLGLLDTRYGNDQTVNVRFGSQTFAQDAFNMYIIVNCDHGVVTIC